jgi:hypothetical protein
MTQPMDPHCVFHGDVPMTEVAKCSTFELIFPNPRDPGEIVTSVMSFETTPGSKYGTINALNCPSSSCEPVTCDL